MASFDWNVLQKAAEEGGKEGRVPPGQYTAQITDAVFKQTSTGKYQVSVTWKVIDGPQAGATVFHNIVLSPESNKAMFMFFQTWDGYGIPKSKFAGSFSLEQAAAMIRGKRGHIVVEERPNPNDPTNPYCNVKSARVVDNTTQKSTAVEV